MRADKDPAIGTNAWAQARMAGAHTAGFSQWAKPRPASPPSVGSPSRILQERSREAFRRIHAAVGRSEFVQQTGSPKPRRLRLFPFR